jgi:hypothetical protein
VPEIVTQVSSAVGIGGSGSDTAILSGRMFPDATANVHFNLFGLDDDTCSGLAVFSSDIAISDVQIEVTSGSFTPTQAVTYRWIARYDGDTNNESVSGECNDENENVVVSRAQPALVTVASDGFRFGDGVLTDSATVTVRVGAVGGATVDFRLYGPDDATCANTETLMRCSRSRQTPPAVPPATGLAGDTLLRIGAVTQLAGLALVGFGGGRRRSSLPTS